MRILRTVFTTLFYLFSILSLLIFITSITLWIRSYSVSEAIGRGIIYNANTPASRFDDLRIWSARGGVGIYFTQTWYPTATSQGFDWFHQTDTMMDYPYASAVAAGVDHTRRSLGPFTYFQARYQREGLWMQIDRGPRQYMADRETSTALVFPYWSLGAISLPLPLLALRRMRRTRRTRRRARLGHCRDCGYDLRDSPARCPECGLAHAGDRADHHP